MPATMSGIKTGPGKDSPIPLRRDERGATAVEYGLILSLIVIAMLVALGNMSDAVVGKWNFIANRVTGA